MENIYYTDLAKIMRKAKKEGIPVIKEGGNYYVSSYIIGDTKYKKISDIEYKVIKGDF